MIKYKDGSDAQVGDVIRWNCWDSDDCVTWKFMGVVRKDDVIYLGGGIDFGLGIGNSVPFAEVVEESENNDCDDRWIEKVGNVRDLYRYIAEFKTQA